MDKNKQVVLLLIQSSDHLTDDGFTRDATDLGSTEPNVKPTESEHGEGNRSFQCNTSMSTMEVLITRPAKFREDSYLLHFIRLTMSQLERLSLLLTN